MSHSSYLNGMFTRFTYNDTVRAAIEAVRAEQNVEAIAMRGISGFFVGFPVVWACNLHPIIVRKLTKEDDEINHATVRVETRLWDEKPHNYVIIDDFVSSGNTVKQIYEEIKKLPYNLVCTKVLLYRRRTDIFTKIMDDDTRLIVKGIWN